MRSGINLEADRDALISLCWLPININAFARCWHRDTPCTGAGCELAGLSASCIQMSPSERLQVKHTHGEITAAPGQQHGPVIAAASISG